MWLGAAIALAASLTLTPVVEKLAFKLNAVSRPDGKRRLQPRPIPVWGGLAVCLAVVAGLLAAHSLDRSARSYTTFLTALGVSAGLICFLGCYDDLRDMNARWKLVGQIAATLPVVAGGFFVDRLVFFGHSVHLGWLGIPWTIAWLVLGMNALNLVDGMDGLASSVGVVISLAIAAVAATHGDYGVMVLSLTVVGALGGFLVYNLPPARIYLGDCGSMLIGLVISSLALVVSFKEPRTVNLTVAALLLFVPLMDTALAIVRRTLNGGSFMVADRGHVHHRLLDRGLPVWAVLGVLLLLTMATGAVAWSTVRSGSELMAWAILACLSAVLVRLRLVGHEEWVLGKRVVVSALVARIATLGQLSRSTDMDQGMARSSLEFAADDAVPGQHVELSRTIAMSDERGVGTKDSESVEPGELYKEAA